MALSWSCSTAKELGTPNFHLPRAFQHDFRRDRGGAKLNDPPDPLANLAPLRDQTDVLEQGRFD